MFAAANHACLTTINRGRVYKTFRDGTSVRFIRLTRAIKNVILFLTARRFYLKTGERVEPLNFGDDANCLL